MHGRPETKKEIESLNKGLTLSPQRKRMKKEIDYKPSSVRWNELRQENLVPSFNKIIHLLKPEKPVDSSTLCTMENVQSFIHVNETISRRLLMENEGLPTITCGNIVAHIVDHLQSQVN